MWNEKQIKWQGVGIGGKGGNKGRIFVITCAKNGKQQKKNKVIKMNGKWKKNKNHMEGMRNEKNVFLQYWEFEPNPYWAQINLTKFC